jgi:hypothetical protein
MSNIKQFPTKKKELVEVKAVPSYTNGYWHEETRPSDKEFDKGYKFLRSHDYRGSFASLPDKPASGCKTKEEIYNTVIPIYDLVKAAVFIHDILDDSEASEYLLGRFKHYYDRHVVFINLKCLPDEYIGFIVFIGEELKTMLSMGQHPASKILWRYEHLQTCWK